MNEINVIEAGWRVPKNIKAFMTTTAGGVSQDNYQSFNLGLHVGDDSSHVLENRERLQQKVGRGVELFWLNQTHSDIVIDLKNGNNLGASDAAVSTIANKACVIMTADCLPVFLCNEQGTKVAALHCGWRGLYLALIAKTIRQHFVKDIVIAWLGPAIGQASYEVNDSLYQRFFKKDNAYHEAFVGNRLGHYLFDLYAIARQQLGAEGVVNANIYGAGFDTFSESRFFSYRRSIKTGRMASVIYLSN